MVCEFGARGNIAAIENAFTEACNRLGYDYDRPTVLKDGKHGLVNWMKQFYGSELAVMPGNVQATVCKRVEELTRGTLWNGEAWVADYRRLRAIAHLSSLL